MIRQEFKNGSGIYKITNKVNNKFYIGSAIDLKHRSRQHKHMLNSNSHSSKYLQNSYNKYKSENFYFEVIEYCSNEQLLIREQHYIDTLNPKYNMCPFAHNQLGYKHSPESILKMKESSKNIPYEVRRYILDCRNKKIFKPMIQYDKDGNFIKEWSSLNEYRKVTGDKNTNISSVLSGKIKTASGYIFKYKN